MKTIKKYKLIRSKIKTKRQRGGNRKKKKRTVENKLSTIKKRKKKSKKKKKKKYIIGIVTVPLTPTKKFYKVCGDSYISSRHITWLKKMDLKHFIYHMILKI